MLEQVTIVGAGPAGLAVAACLKQRQVQATLLDAAAHVGSSWRAHYDRLHLHTHKGGSALPGLPFPADYPRYPSRDQFVAYLEAYARHFHLQPVLEERATCITPQGARWCVQTTKREILTKHVVVATGLTRVPVQPTWPGLDEFRGEVLHSSRYKNGAPWRGKRVLVVGLGNSGGEIAIDLHEHGAVPTLSVRGPVNVIPRELFGLPILLAGALLRRFPPRIADLLGAPLLALSVGDITKLGLRRKAYGAMEQIAREGRIPLIDVGTLALVEQGHATFKPGIERFTETAAVFEGGATEPFDAVILATGYRPALEELLPEVGPGAHVCGLKPSTRGMLNEIGVEARRTAHAICAALQREAA